MSIDDGLISYTERPDGRVDVRYDGEQILVAGEPPATKFRANTLRILISRHISELRRDERIEYYRRSERARM